MTTVVFIVLGIWCCITTWAAWSAYNRAKEAEQLLTASSELTDSAQNGRSRAWRDRDDAFAAKKKAEKQLESVTLERDHARALLERQPTELADAISQRDAAIKERDELKSELTESKKTVSAQFRTICVKDRRISEAATQLAELDRQRLAGVKTIGDCNELIERLRKERDELRADLSNACERFKKATLRIAELEQRSLDAEASILATTEHE